MNPYHELGNSNLRHRHIGRFVGYDAFWGVERHGLANSFVGLVAAQRRRGSPFQRSFGAVFQCKRTVESLFGHAGRLYIDFVGDMVAV